MNTCLSKILLLWVVFQFSHSVGVESSAVRLKTCVITVRIKKRSGKSVLNSIEVLISRALIDWYISYD